jgi:hypothetical protein
MPRGNPGKLVALRLDPALLAAVKERSSNVTRAVEEGLRWWLAREKRKKAATPDPLPCPVITPAAEPRAGNET